MRTTARVNAWKNVEGVMGDIRISRKRKGNILRLSSCVTAAYVNALESMALTKKQQEKVQVCENQTGKNNRGS